ncbi:hypothetical protein TVAG_302310 [Trichomonas vaginalis G3]|uniref:Viral A-type inclusion protein n=1 Tax=Trichomonas vaginalis (strain ATCC PRA-98 / G3) TaxID=412133 RepID=A2EGQ6_TRIV3|nr:A-type inclusion protein-related family [Trichomonas vaginalis G3]EAY08144.1 hypothetical protein TVAG_302310 [Trichomonas vaginalis G3]KAI5548725.1 A-type inclusion protein-related family [Trichomonas vaginalis G3]|eukprot:XP_001320367.1 hypothetical protein [Trichomonas vaginalis G3]
MDSDLSSPITENGDSESVDFFCAQFNAKFGVSTTNLQQVLDICDALFSDLHQQQNPIDVNGKIEKLKKKLNDTRAKNSDLIGEIQDLANQNEEMQNIIENLQHEINAQKEKCNYLESNLNNSQNQIAELKQGLERGTQTKNNLQKSLDTLSDMYQDQISEVTSLAQQRTQLLKIIQKQKLLNEGFENEAKSVNAKSQVKQVPAPIPDNFVDLFTILASITKAVSEVLPSTLLPELVKIRDNAECSPIDRVTQIINTICTSNKNLESTINANNDKINEITQENEKLQQNVINVLALFEEELSFMQNLSTSNDISSSLLYRPEIGGPIHLDEKSREFLIRRCANNAKFIQETISTIRIEDIQESIESADPTHIFDLLIPNNLSDKLHAFYNRMGSNDNPIFRELFDMYAAQIFSNSLLQNHCVEVRSRYEILQRNLNQAKQELEAKVEPNKQILKEIVRLRKREEKIKILLSQFFDVGEERNIVKLVFNALKTLTAEKSEQQKIEEKSEENPKFEEKVTEKSEIENDENIKELNDKIEDLTRKLANAKEMKQEMEERMNELQNDFANKQKSMDEVISKYKAQNEESINQLKSATAQLEDLRHENTQKTEEISQLKENSTEINDQLREAKDLIQQMKIERRELKQHVDMLETANRKSIDRLKEKSQSLRHEYEKAVQETQAELASARIELETTMDDYRKLLAKSEEKDENLIRLQAMNKTFELKLKAMDEKRMSETNSLQMQMQTQLDSVIAQSRAKITQKEEENLALIVTYSHRFEERYNLSLIPSSLSEFLETLENELEKKNKAQIVYEETVSDLLRVQHLLNLLPSSNIFDAVNDLFAEKEKLKQQHESDSLEIQKMTEKFDETIKERKQTLVQIEALREWDNWARRLHRIVCERSCTTYSSEKLRLSLEEAILSAVSQKTILNRLENLRQQKTALLLVDRPILTTRTQTIRPTWASIISVCVSCRRIQKMAGAVSIISQTPTTVELNASYTSYDSLNSTKPSNQSDESIRYPPLFTSL